MLNGTRRELVMASQCRLHYGRNVTMYNSLAIQENRVYFRHPLESDFDQLLLFSDLTGTSLKSEMHCIAYGRVCDTMCYQPYTDEMTNCLRLPTALTRRDAPVCEYNADERRCISSALFYLCI